MTSEQRATTNEQVMDDADRAQEIEERDRAAALARAKQARKRLSGFISSSDACAECGAPIPRKRRLALPETTRCVDCQAERERRK